MEPVIVPPESNKEIKPNYVDKLQSFRKSKFFFPTLATLLAIFIAIPLVIYYLGVNNQNRANEKLREEAIPVISLTPTLSPTDTTRPYISPTAVLNIKRNTPTPTMTPSTTPSPNTISVYFVNGSGKPVNVTGQKVTMYGPDNWNRVVTSDTVLPNVPMGKYNIVAVKVDGYNNSTGFTKGDGPTYASDYRPYDNSFTVGSDAPINLYIIYYPK